MQVCPQLNALFYDRCLGCGVFFSATGQQLRQYLTVKRWSSQEQYQQPAFFGEFQEWLSLGSGTAFEVIKDARLMSSGRGANDDNV